MKKSMFLLGIATVALASCTNEEVVEMPQNRAIQFEAFANAATRANAADNEVTSITDFYVFGKYGYDGTATTVFDNELSSKQAYWQPSQTYRFGGYYDGTANTKNTNASFEPSTGTLTIPDYTPDNAKDLMAAVSDEVTTGADVTSQSAVSMNFKHLLSEVKFTFTTEDADVYTLAISNLKINGAESTNTVTYNGTNITWGTATASNGYTLDDIADVAVEASNYTAASSAFFIPQDETDKLTVTFTATVNCGGLNNVTGNFTAPLGYTKDQVAATTDNTWTAGYRYNYTATINADDIDPTLEEKIIEFTPSVTPWENADNTVINPTPQN